MGPDLRVCLVKAPDLKKMIGPLPLGGWIAVVVVGIGAAIIINRRRSSEPVVSTAGGFVPAEASPFEAGAGTGVTGYPTPGVVLDGTPVSNSQWVTYATRSLTALGRPEGPYMIGRALQKYVDGTTLSPAEQAIVEAALRQVGMPPEGAPIAPDPTPVTAPSPAPAGQPPFLAGKNLGKRRTTVQKVGNRSESTAEVARRVYGSSIFTNELRFVNAGFYNNPGWKNRKPAPTNNTPLPAGMSMAY